MRVKHLAFRDLQRDQARAGDPHAPDLRDAWVASQVRWLEASRSSSGLVTAWGALHRHEARAVFVWESDEALREFMQAPHARAIADIGVVGKSSALYLEPLLDLGPRKDARYVAEAVAWIKEGGVEPWLASQRAWCETMARCDGFVGGAIARGRRTFVTTAFWRDDRSHARYLDEVVPRLRSSAWGDEHCARLTRFHAPLCPELSYQRR